jgi:hypothetical protein
MNTLVPIRIGEPARAFLVQKREGTGFFEAFSSIIAERVLDLLCIVTLATTALLMLPTAGYPDWILNSLRTVALLASIALAILVVGARKGSSLLSFFDRTVFKLPIGKWKDKLAGLAEELIRGVKGLSYKPSTTLALVAQSLAIWLLSALGLYLMFKAFSIEIAPAIALLGAMLMNLTYALPAPPGYVGSFEAYWSLIFVVGLGFPLAQALPVGLTAHMLAIIIEVTLGCAVLTWLGLSFKELRITAVKRLTKGS